MADTPQHDVAASLRIRPPSPGTFLPADQRLRLAKGATLARSGLAMSREPLKLANLNTASMAQVEAWCGGEPVGSAPQSQRLAMHLLAAGILEEHVPSGSVDLATVTAVIAVRDDLDGLSGLMDYFSQLGVSTVIVDDGSHDAHGVATVAAQATLIRHDDARGPAAARNAGIRASLTPWVFLVDSDVDLKNFDLERFASWCQRDDAALIAPRVIGSQGRSLRERFDRRNSPLDLGPEPGRIGARKAINFVPSAAMLLRTGILDAPFDETLLVGEDVDLVWRLEEAGWNLLYRPEYLVTHRTRATWSAWLTQRYGYARAAADLSERHGEQAAPVRGSALTIGAWVLLLSGYTTPAISLFSLSKRRLDASLIQFDNDALSAIIFAKAALRPGPRLARQLLRTYGLALLGGCLFSKRIRRLTFTAVLLGGIDRWWRSERDLDPLRFLAVSTLEDLAYATGLSAGAVRRRSPKALLPRLTWRSRS